MTNPSMEARCGEWLGIFENYLTNLENSAFFGP
jgi:hypothetical protein